MKGNTKKVITWMIVGAISMTTLQNMNAIRICANVADEEQYDVPAADINGRVGANMPYTRYDSKSAVLGGGAKLESSEKFERMNIASQASEQSYISLPGNGAYGEWTVKSTGAGVTMRFTMPDSSDGKGLKGSLDVYVNDSKVQTVDLTSYYMWQYFSGGNPSDKNDGGPGCFAFDEVHFKLPQSLNVGDKIRIQSSGANGLKYGVDFLEIEEIPPVIAKPQNALSVVDYGAKPNDNTDDYNAIRDCISAANMKGVDVYFPEGTYRINRKWNISAKNIKITGAGMWHTNIQFTNDQSGQGGICFNGEKACSNLEFCNMYLNSNLCSRYNQNANYKCFSDVPGNGTVIHDIWEDHFECGLWIGDYSGSVDYSDGMKIINCRLRNNLADGVNFCQGTSNSVVYNCSIRNNGDDGLACWNNNYLSAKEETGNIFAYNTIDFIWRAGGIAIYGGDNFQIYNNYICDTFMAAGIHLNTTFDGYKFNNTTNITFANNTLVRCGTYCDSWKSSLGAVDVSQNVKNVTFENTKIYDAQHDAISVKDNISGISFQNTVVYGAGVDGQFVSGNRGAAIRATGSPKVSFDGLEIANISYGGAGKPYWFAGTQSGIQKINEVITDKVAYEVPGYPEPVVDVTIPTETTSEPEETTAIEQTVIVTGNGGGQEKQTDHQETEIKRPARVKINKIKKTSGKMKVTLKKIKGVRKYVVKVSTSKKFPKKKTVTKTVTKNWVDFKKIDCSKKYYIKARAYKIVGTKKYYGKWSKVVRK